MFIITSLSDSVDMLSAAVLDDVFPHAGTFNERIATKNDIRILFLLNIESPPKAFY
jgi:hypothetical protein